VAAPLITVLVGVPHAQSLKMPPVVKPPLFVSNPLVYGKILMGRVHFARAF